MTEILRGAFQTNSGMLAIWEPEHFRNITDYPSWEDELCEDEDILRHIQEGAFVPVNIQSDGTFECEVRVGSTENPAELSERERRYLTVSSERYQFRSRDKLAISGLEHIGPNPGRYADYLDLGIGEWATTVHLVDWPSEPGARTETGEPTSTALPDFVILLNPAESGTQFRMQVNTFEKP